MARVSTLLRNLNVNSRWLEYWCEPVSCVTPCGAQIFGFTYLSFYPKKVYCNPFTVDELQEGIWLFF